MQQQYSLNVKIVLNLKTFLAGEVFFLYIRSMKQVLVVFLAALVGACTPQEDYYKPQSKIVVERFQVTNQINGGYAGGETEFGSGGVTANGSNFLSQYPLKDFIYQQNVTYDSIVRYTVTAQGDTIPGSVDYEIISRDTIGFYTDSKWLPFDYWNEKHLLNLYIGVASEADLQGGVSLSIESTGNMEAGYDLAVFMPDSLSLAERLGVAGGINPTRHTFTQDGPLVLTEGQHYTIKQDVPIYDEFGVVSGTQFGIEVAPIVFFQQLVTDQNNIVPENRAFTVSVEVNGQKITSAFTIRFVEEQTYLDRQCWLALEFECKDLFNE